MKPFKPCWRLNTVLTLMISLVLIMLVVLDRWIEYEYTLIPQEKKRQMVFFQDTSTRMWQTVSDLMLAGSPSQAESFLTSYSTDIGFEKITLINDGRILLANNFALKGRNTREVSCYQGAWVQQAMKGFRPVIETHPARINQLCAVMPVTLSEQNQALRPGRLGVLVVQYSMQPDIQALKQQFWHSGQWVRHLLFAVLTALFIALIMRRFVLVPLQNIRSAMQAYAKGDVRAWVRTTGGCELAEVGRNFNHLADQVNRAEQEVRRNEARWVKALDAAGDGVWDWDLRNNRIFFSAQWKRMLGYALHELDDTPEQWQALIHPDDRAQADAALQAHIRGESELYRAVYRMQCKAGHYKWFSDRGMVFDRDADGQALRVTGIHSDISDQKQTEAALKESQQQFELAMQGANDGLWDWHVGRDEVYFSPRWKAMLGHADEEIENRFSVWEALLHPDDIARTKEELARCVTGKKDLYEIEFRLRHKDGHWLTILSRAIVVRDGSGHTVRLVGTHMDITEIREVQRQLEESRQQLKQLAFYDALTGLPNRRLLEDRLHQMLAHSRRGQQVQAVAMMDLDGFKQVNDTLGHDVGDELLKSVTERLTLNIRDCDSVARLGGDEFVLLFSDLADRDAVRNGLERIIRAVGEPYALAGQTCRVTASIGVAFFPGDATTGDILLRYADLAMYHSKQAGRNRYTFYDASMNLMTPVRGWS